MARVTDDEARNIIKLYEDGKNFKEIKELTGRSREAIDRVLSIYGLIWGKYDDYDMTHIAERMYRKYIDDKYGYSNRNKYKHFRDLTPNEQSAFLIPAKKQIIDRHKQNYDLLFTGIDNSKVKTEEVDSINLNLKPAEMEALHYISLKYELDVNTLIGFLIMKEQVQLKIKEQKNDYKNL